MTAQPDGDCRLSVRELRVHFPTADGVVKSVDGVSLDLRRGEIVGVVGESGSGKSVLAQSILGLHNGSRALLSGRIRLAGHELVGASERELAQLRGSAAAMIFQDSQSGLHPYHRIGDQVAEAYLAHHRVSRTAARRRAVEMLDRVGIPVPDKRYRDYPHQLSGGMRQRVMIAMALVCEPDVLIADEPTTALDVTVQAQILELIAGLRAEFGMAVLLITHDLGVVAQLCDRVIVMYAGQFVETATADELFYQPEMPYTWGLLNATPRPAVRPGADGPDGTRRLRPIEGQPPSLIRLPPGCAFEPRCGYRDLVAGQRCRTERPRLVPVVDDGSTGHEARCHIEPARRRRLWADTIQPAR